jgi:hypothetical protein
MKTCSVCGSLGDWADYGTKPVCISCMCKAIYLAGKQPGWTLDKALLVLKRLLNENAA